MTQDVQMTLLVKYGCNIHLGCGHLQRGTLEVVALQ